MFKLLLMRESPDKMWSATREGACNAHALHFIADVSAATAHRFVKAMSEADFLRVDRRGLHLVRVEALLHSWRATYTSWPPAMIEARPLFDIDYETIGTSLAGGRVALGGPLAADHFDLRHATHGRQAAAGTVTDFDEDAKKLLQRSLGALEPWANDVVLIGGWAMQVFRYIDGADASVEIQHTRDVDIASDGALVPPADLVRPSRLPRV